MSVQLFKQEEIQSELGAVVNMTSRLFPGCKVKTDMIDGAQFNEPDYILVRVIWSDSQITVEQKNESLVRWHSELFEVAPTVSAGAFRLQVEYPE